MNFIFQVAQITHLELASPGTEPGLRAFDFVRRLEKISDPQCSAEHP